MTKEGTVTQTGQGKATVLVKTHNACDACRAECGGHCDKARLETIVCRDPVGASVGDRVEVSTETASVILWAALIFVLPLFTAILSGTTLHIVFERTPISLSAALISALAVFAVLNRVYKNKSETEVFTVSRVIKGENENA